MQISIEQKIIGESGNAYLLLDRGLAVRGVGGRLDIFGPGADLVGQHLLELLPELYGSEAELEALLAGRLARLSLPEINRDGPGGEPRYYDLLTLPSQGADGRVDGLLQLITDVTERALVEQARAQQRSELRMLKERITQQNIELARANAELRRSARLKDQFLAGMSHEVRTPLTAILGLIELLRLQFAGPLNSHQLEYVNGIEQSGEHLLALINDFLDIAKIEAGQVSLDWEVVGLPGLAEASIRMMRELASKKGLSLSLEVDPQVQQLRGDERRLRQMLLNLLSNAIKFTPPEGAVGLEIRGHPEEELVRLTVWDTGVGIADDQIPLLFKPFTQLENSYQRQHTGSGLGLVIVAELAALHGGSVTVSSEPGRGSRFTLALPWSQAEQERELGRRPADLGAGEAAGPLVLAPPGSPLLLLAEDDQVSAAMLCTYLKSCGYTISLAISGEEALACAREQPPALVLLDMQMHGIDGLETLRQLREAPVTRRTPIVALTALAMPGDRERCLEAGASSYMSKPVSLRRLAALVASLLA